MAFITDEPGVTVTEGSNGKAAVNACIDEELLLNTPLLVTFYQPGDYRIFCRLDRTLMHIIVRVH